MNKKITTLLICTPFLCGCTSALTALRGNNDHLFEEMKTEIADLRHSLHGTEVELKLLKRVPSQYLGDAHHWLILHGRYVCVARRPLCERCAVARWCDSAPRELRAERDRPPEPAVPLA